MRLLALDTTSEACTAALYLDGEIREVGDVAPRRHAELILSLVSDLLDEAGIPLQSLDALAFGRGPGSFTGVRIGTGVIQGLAFGADLPVAPVSSLGAVAEAVLRERGEARVLAAFDARRDEVYWGAFTAGVDGHALAAGPERVCPPEAVPVPADGIWFGAGGGWDSYGPRLRERLGARVGGVDETRLPRAREVAALGAAAAGRGETVAAELVEPVYLRDRVTG